MMHAVPIREAKFRTDQELLDAYQASGNQADLATLYMRYSDLVLGVALKYLKERETAKDAVMNIYQELIGKLQTHKVDNFKSWLHVVTKNHCLMRLRKENKTMIVEFQSEHMQSEEYLHLDHVLERERELRTLENCIEKLGDEQKKVIKLFYLEGKCYNEISDTTGIDWDKIRSLMQNGRRNLKICMTKNA